jgi:hypothetical protein
MICVKCGQRYSPCMRLDDPAKCEDCQPTPALPDMDPEVELLPPDLEYLDLGGEA